MYDLSGMFEIGDVDGDIDGEEMDGDAVVTGDDVLGALLSGDMDGDVDGDAIVSGLRNPFRRRNARRNKIKRLIAAKKAQSGMLLKSLRPNKWRRYPIGFVSLAVPASGTVNVTATPQVPFRGQRLTIPGTIAINFVINSLVIGKDNQFAGSGAIPATTFAENAVGEDMNLDTAQIGNTIVLNVSNIDTVAAHDFRATVLGDAVMMANV
jgi:hypothetical protein